MSFDLKLGLCEGKKGTSGILSTWTVSLPFPEEGSGICSSLCPLDPNYHLLDIWLEEAKKAAGKNSRCGQGTSGAATRPAGWTPNGAVGWRLSHSCGVRQATWAVTCTAPRASTERRRRPAPQTGLGHRPWPPPGTSRVRVTERPPCHPPVTADARAKHHSHVTTAVGTPCQLYRS